MPGAAGVAGGCRARRAERRHPWGMDASQLRVVVEPPAATGGRRVRVGREILGLAHGPADLLEFLRRAGLDPQQVAMDDPLIDWHGGGPDVWTRETP